MNSQGGRGESEERRRVGFSVLNKCTELNQQIQQPWLFPNRAVCLLNREIRFSVALALFGLLKIMQRYL